MSARADRTTRKVGTLLAVAVAALVLTGSDAHAQTARITGKVVDLASGDRIEGVSITFKHIATGRVFEGETSKKGTYRIANVPFGGFEVTVVKAGYQTLRTAYHVEARSSEPTVVDVEMARG